MNWKRFLALIISAIERNMKYVSIEYQADSRKENTKPIKSRPMTEQSRCAATKATSSRVVNTNTDDTACRDSKSIDRTSKVQLPADYNTAKLLYRASKTRASGREQQEKYTGVDRAADKISSRSNNSSVSTTSAAIIERSADSTDTPLPTVESGLQTLGLIRPIDNKAYEFGLANGIMVHLIESVKLCGLKKAREKSITDMITTLCNHLSSREDEISRWIEFADKIALKAAERINASTREYQVICNSLGEAQDEIQLCQDSLLTKSRELLLLKNDVLRTRDEALEVMNTFSPFLRECEVRLRHEIRQHCDGVRSIHANKMHESVELLRTSHDIERQQLEHAIHTLEESNRIEVEKNNSLRVQVDNVTASLEKENNNSKAVIVGLQEDVSKARDEYQVALENIKSLKLQLESERVQKQVELATVEQKMRAELDAIDEKVKISFQKFNQQKNKAIEEALEKARIAEERANETQRLMTNLRLNVIQKVSKSTSDNYNMK